MCLVQANLGVPANGVVSGGTRFADALDSMGLAEFIMVLARDYDTTPAAIEELAGRQFDTGESTC